MSLFTYVMYPNWDMICGLIGYHDFRMSTLRAPHMEMDSCLLGIPSAIFISSKKIGPGNLSKSMKGQ